MPRPVLLAVGGDPAAKTTIEWEPRMCDEAIKLLLGHLLPGEAAPRGGT